MRGTVVGVDWKPSRMLAGTYALTDLAFDLRSSIVGAFLVLGFGSRFGAMPSPLFGAWVWRNAVTFDALGFITVSHCVFGFY